MQADDLVERDLAAGGIVSVSPEVAKWWTKSALIGMATKLPHGEELRDAISSGYLNTPGRVMEHSWLNRIHRATKPVQTHDPEIISDRQMLIGLVPQLARGSALARIQEFCYEPLTIRDFEEILGEPVDSVPGLEQMLIRYNFEEKQRVRLAHPTYREAIDSYLSDPANFADAESWLTSRPLANQLLSTAVRAYSFISSVIADPDGWVDRPTPPEVCEWSPQILAVSQSEPTIAALRAMKWDLWTATELAYEIIRLYPDIKNKGGREFIREMLYNDDASGAYAVLEACLYLRSSANDEVWSALKARLYDLMSRQHHHSEAHGEVALLREEQLALAVDGLLWRPPPIDIFTQQFLVAAFEDVSTKDPLWGILRFAAGYHPGGLAALGIDALVEEDEDVVLTPEQIEFVAWLLRWHFVHQSRARAILARQPYVDQDFLCRSLHASPVEPGLKGLRRLMACLIAQPSTAGWAIHLGCNLLSIGVAVDDTCRALMRESMGVVGDADLGVITCALTYAAAAQFSDVLRSYFSRPQNRDVLLDAVCEGPVVNGVRIRPPRFVCARSPSVVQADLNLYWPRLHQAGFDASDPERVARLLRGRAEVLASIGELDGKSADRLLERVRLGDLRLLEQAVSARDAPEDLVDHILQVGTFALSDPPQLF
jgi:hypothetical protein